MASTKLQKLYLSLNRFALLQILIGIASTTVCVSAVGKDRSEFHTIEEEHSSAVKYVIMGLDVGAVISSAWIVLSGLVPFYMKFTQRGLVKTKVAFMVCCIMAAAVFVPFILGAAITSVVLRDDNDGKTMALPGLMAALSLVEMAVAVAASVYCCRSPWAECKLADKPIDVETAICGKIAREEKRREKDEKKKEKDERKKEEEERKMEKKEMKKMLKESNRLAEEKGEKPPPYHE